MILSGDFNVWTEAEGRVYADGVVECRKLKDKKINREGEKFLEWIEEGGWYMANGIKKGDEEGEFTYVGTRGTSV